MPLTKRASKNVKFTDNSVSFNAEGNGGNGGAVYISSAAVTLENVTMRNNAAANHAGALYLGSCDLTLDASVSFTGNSAGNHGGAIYVTYKNNEDGTKTGSVLTVNGTTFQNNSALAGGAISGSPAVCPTIAAMVQEFSESCEKPPTESPEEKLIFSSAS